MPRLHINVNEQTSDALRDLAKRRDITLTETLRRAISILKFIEDDVIDENKELHLRDNHTGEVTRLQIL